ncbi:MAG: FAD binding domain-containing protein [Oscillospiraceae bacterium]|jgi:CO/xanthine dehydrogenase FAD-binding subunit|nr:FAD binding domain-containing protein [Oscillospiraceae bacterium]
MVSYLPQSLSEALELLASTGAIPYGGGTDLMVEGKNDASYLFLHKIPELGVIAGDADYIRIGASCTFTRVADHPLCPGILKEAILQIAAPAIRNLGTIGGNIGNGSPKADSALIFFVTGSRLRLVSKRGERIIPIKDFYLGRRSLDLRPGELIAEVLIPKMGYDRYYYRKVGARDALAISRLSFAGIIKTQGDRIVNLATAFGAVSDVIIRREDIDAMLIGKTLAEAKTVRDNYLAAYAEAIVPIRGRVSEKYRKRVCMNLLRDFLDTMNI